MSELDKAAGDLVKAPLRTQVQQGPQPIQVGPDRFPRGKAALGMGSRDFLPSQPPELSRRGHFGDSSPPRAHPWGGRGQSLDLHTRPYSSQKQQ